MIDELKEDMEVQIALSEAPDQVIATVKIVAFRERDVEGNGVKDVVIEIAGSVELLPGEKIIDVVKNEDGTFKSADELAALYGGKGIDGSRETIAYCRIGERSSHTWFVLTQLLGHKNVRNYDGSWTEWGSIVGAPIEKP